MNTERQYEMAKQYSVRLRRQTKDGPIDANLIMTPVEEADALVASHLVADLEYQANSGYQSIFDGNAPIRVHIFEEEVPNAAVD